MDSLSDDVLYYIMSYIDSMTLLLIYAICQRFVKFSRTNLKSLLRENLQRTRRLNLQNYNMKQLFRLSKLSFSNDISAGLNHSIMIANTGQVYVCGSDSNG